ncbi:MAG TPA: hypothetical protein VJ624_03480, partial [Thermodesulfobacteriota bacterium]|nr:hypothetical protein [Thermodesulfobacteriota bacterium]
NLNDLDFPDIKLLNILVNDVTLLPSLLNLLPSEILREIGTRKFAWALSFTELVLLGLVLLWTYNNRESLERDLSLFRVQDKQRQTIQASLETQNEKIALLKRVNEETKTVKEYLKQKSNIHLPLESLPFLIPEKVCLESMLWGAGASNQPITPATTPSTLGLSGQDNLMILKGTIDAPLPEEKYFLFFRFFNNLRSSPFVEKADFQTEKLLPDGLFQINLYLKRIEPKHGLNE